jgi:hypothetical protein
MAGAPTASAVSADTPSGRRNANRTIRNINQIRAEHPRDDRGGQA